MWGGAAELWVILITYDAFVIFPHPLSQPLLMTLTFSVATVLLIWCSAELSADGLTRLQARRSSTRAQPSEVGWGAWIVAAVLNFLVVWSGYGVISWHRHPDTPGIPDNGFYSFGTLLVTTLIVIAFDISLARTVIALKHAKKQSSRIST